MVATPQDPSIIARVARLEQAIKNLTQKGPIDPLSFVGRPHYAADGTPMRFFEVRDDLGSVRLAVWDISDADGSAVKGHQQVLEYDIGGRLVRSQDLDGGWAEPWFAVPMTPKFTPPANTAFSYFSIGTTASGMSQGVQLAEGRIPYVSHPRLSIDGVWGQASGTVVPTYSLTVGALPAFTWSQTSIAPTQQGPIDISSLLRNTGVTVSLTVTWTGSGSIACHPFGCYLRQS